ncbi:heparin-binding EGF-like growth factor b [Triplophysa dalaica]|uniref:heparin-binding EGF-like growth factor b n=1 Tax=Triplophysa dalaica TaxID=1582913 RepID=UPI0024DF3EC1|nr:heparin-binding EGF-like growth factor b [Triplophysa dalaica]
MLRVGIIRFHCLVLVCSGAFVDRYESAKPSTTVVNLIHTLEETRTTEHLLAETVHVDDNEYDEDFISGDYELYQPRVAFSTKPKHPSLMPTTENKRKGRRKGKGKGKGRKKNPCLREYKDFCIHGVCHYLKELQSHTCVCEAGFSGERCHLFTLAVAKVEQRYNRTTALAVMAVVLSLMCLTIIGILLALRYHKKNDDDVESEEKVKLETTSVK